ncbi:MAG: hypothetical protein IKY09_02775 [Methanocorpusculum sp.]|nr:hypothetical protein [Methanocorpusculum sp.]MBR5450174.1 hypothetical protein [Methanocorpusculum sp.]
MLSLKLNMTKVPDFSEIQEFAESANAKVLVGFLSGRQHVKTQHKGKDGKYKNIDGGDAVYEQMETAELAKILTFGDARIPPRPFIEEGLLSKKDDLKKEIGKQLDQIKDGKKANWNKVGTKAVGAIQEFVRSDYYKNRVPNAKRTIDYKGSDTPLIDGGDLINSLEFVVEA